MKRQSQVLTGIVFPQTVYCWGSQCCLKCVRLGWGAVSASQSLSPVSQFVSHLALSFTLALSRIWLCLPVFSPPFVPHLALSFTLAGVLCPPRWACLLSPNLSPNLSFTLAGVLCPPRWACLPICLPSGFVSPSGFVFHLGWDAVSASVGLSPVSQFVFQFVSQFVSHLALSPSFVSPFVPHLALSFTLAGVLSPPRWACPVLSPNLSPIWLCLPVLSPHLFPIWLCLSPWLGRRVRLLGLVSQFVSQAVSHLALSFTLAGVLCPPCWACLPICLPPGFVFHLGWGAVSASLGLSPNLSPISLCLSPWLGCCVRLARLVCGLVSQFVSHLALSPSFLSPFVSHLALSFTLAVGCCVLLVLLLLPTYLPTLPYPTLPLPYPTLPYPISVPY